MPDFVWNDIAEGTPTNPDPINALGAQVEEISNRGAQYAYSFTASSAIGTTATGILTIVGATLVSGKAYSVENIGGILSDTAGRLGDFQLWTPNTSGSLIGAFYRSRAEGGSQMNCYGKIYLKRTAAANFVGDLVLSVAASAGTVTHDAFTNRPRALVVTDVGPAAKFPYAFDVP